MRSVLVVQQSIRLCFRTNTGRGKGGKEEGREGAYLEVLPLLPIAGVSARVGIVGAMRKDAPGTVHLGREGGREGRKEERRKEEANG